MSITYEQIDADTTKEVEVTERIIDIKELKEQEKRLKEKLAEVEPTDEDLLQFGRYMHPYYIDREIAEMELEKVETKLKELKQK